jgi:cytochrome c biogenesis protein CcdA
VLADDTYYERVGDFDRGLRRFQKISIVVGISIIIAAGIVIASLWNTETATIKFELARLVAQAILIVLGEALLNLVAREYQLRQTQVEARKEIVASVLGRTLNAYNGVKRAQRLPRAQALKSRR